MQQLRSLPLQVQLEATLGPDPINPCADLAGIGGQLQDQLRRIGTEIRFMHKKLAIVDEEIEKTSCVQKRDSLLQIQDTLDRHLIDQVLQRYNHTARMIENIYRGIDRFIY